jgi:hypothetical protein
MEFPAYFRHACKGVRQSRTKPAWADPDVQPYFRMRPVHRFDSDSAADVLRIVMKRRPDAHVLYRRDVLEALDRSPSCTLRVHKIGSRLLLRSDHPNVAR